MSINLVAVENSNVSKVGIIIPTYNVEQYIFRGIESCINQTYLNIEIIIVDDGSTDSTYEIAKSYARQDDRIVTYKQKNFGVSSARNKALEICTSDYVIFLDSDDWLELDTVEKLINHLPNSNENVLVSADTYFAYFREDDIFKEKSPYIMNPIEMSSDDALLFTSKHPYKLCSSCYKLFSMNVIRKNNLRFEQNIKHGEDGLFVFEYLKCIDKFIYFPELLWNILERPGSATQSSYNKTFLSAIDAVDKMLAYDNCKELDKTLKNYKTQRMMGVLCCAIVDLKQTKEDVVKVRKELRKDIIRFIITEKSIKRRLIYIFVSFAPKKIVSVCYSIYKKGVV